MRRPSLEKQVTAHTTGKYTSHHHHRHKGRRRRSWVRTPKAAYHRLSQGMTPGRLIMIVMGGALIGVGTSFFLRWAFH